MSTAAPMRPAPWTFAAPWGARGYVSDIDGPVHWIEFTPAERQRREHPNAAAFLAASRSLMRLVGQRHRLGKITLGTR
jgi:hypothetical protein